MDNPNLDTIEKEVENKIKKRSKKKQKTMKVSGAKVKDLQKIIKNK